VLQVIWADLCPAPARADGRIGSFDRVLAIWVFVIATFPLTAGAYVTL